MQEPQGWKPFYHEYEYPDQAGYPDGVGTLDEGTKDRMIEDEFSRFLTVEIN
ncbi:hypothetical protein KK092_07155 [Curtobacterium flaccumfaciens pv. flaccumfaciens]|uniref:hypothetical protein n=1 Tax=Curtobacterium flaccumfaciens TaxID=2035 RepID=UPI001BDE1B62|nr:hypothetical protein [Curtobacterium flaccumfaciens]MBT1669155.1 hypothetical protein [Curtobacterium flaccumfaciens pv. flaccumfaciens]